MRGLLLALEVGRTVIVQRLAQSMDDESNRHHQAMIPAKVWPIAMSLLALAACHREPTLEVKARSILAPQMRDPTSFLLRNLREITDIKGTKVICGEVNSKNQYNGYDGFGSFAATESQPSKIEKLSEVSKSDGLYYRSCVPPAERAVLAGSEKDLADANANEVAADLQRSKLAMAHAELEGSWTATNPQSMTASFDVKDGLISLPNGYQLLHVGDRIDPAGHLIVKGDLLQNQGEAIIRNVTYTFIIHDMDHLKMNDTDYVRAN